MKLSRRFIGLVVCCALLGCSKGSKSPTAPVDTNPPSTTSDLVVTASDATSVTLGWIAPGGDGSSGSAAAYEIRYGNTDTVLQTNWSQWTVVTDPPAPHAAGTHETFTVTSLSTASEFVLALRSKDAAGNWSGESNVVVGRTAGYRTGPVLVVARSNNYPYVTYSENGGRTWKNGSVSGSNVWLGWIERDPFNANTLYGLAPTLGQNLGGAGATRIWKSTDHGITWNILTGGGAFLNGGGCTSLAVSPTVPGLLYVNVKGVCLDGDNNCCDNCAGLIYKSSDGGVSWQNVSNYNRQDLFTGWTSFQMPFRALAVDPTNGEHLYAGGQYWSFNSGAVYYPPMVVSSNGGSSWSGGVTGGIHDETVMTIDINPSDPAKMLISSGTGIYRSVDAGANWINVSTATSQPLDFVHDPNRPEYIYTARVKSIDGGQTWLPLATPVGGQATIGIDPSRNELYAVGSGGGYRSADGGLTWSQVLTMSNCSSIAVLPDLPASALSHQAVAAKAGTTLVPLLSRTHANERHYSAVRADAK